MMNALSRQLTLGLTLRDEATFAHFYAGNNAEIVAALKKTAAGQGERMIYLGGTRGQGCSHLLQAVCHHAHQSGLTSVYLPLSHLIATTPDMLQGLESLDLVCLDDLQRIAGHNAWEEAVFHFYNKMADNNKNLIVSANTIPRSLNLRLPDLISRLSAGIVFQLSPLADIEKLAILSMRAKRRGIHLSEEVSKYILTHCPRHMGTLCAALDALDKASLAAQRRLTIPFVKEVLEI